MTADAPEVGAVRSQCSSTAMRWLLIVAVVEAVCALVLRLMSMLGHGEVVSDGRRGVSISVVRIVLVLILLHAVWRVVREQRRDRATGRRAAEHMNTMLSASREWFWTLDGQGLFVFCSPASKDVVGYEPSELIGQSCSFVMDVADLLAAEKYVLTQGGPDGEISGMEVACQHRDGRVVWTEASGKVRRDEEGREAGFDGTIRLIGPESVADARAARITTRVQTVLEQRLLLIAFQPICALATGEVVGAEALSRFVTERAQPPDVWFAEAASVGLGTELELLAAQLALEAARKLPVHLYVSVNLSPSTFLDPRVITLLDQCAIAPERIVLELTEHAAISDYDAVKAVQKVLAERGIRIAIDDAGSGFASGQLILALRPEIIKLDRAIISGIDADPTRRAFAAAFAVFGSHVGATVLAEGIETVAELAALTAIGMHCGQGYLLGRPSLEPAEWASWQPKRNGTQTQNQISKAFDPTRRSSQR